MTEFTVEDRNFLEHLKIYYLHFSFSPKFVEFWISHWKRKFSSSEPDTQRYSNKSIKFSGIVAKRKLPFRSIVDSIVKICQRFYVSRRFIAFSRRKLSLLTTLLRDVKTFQNETNSILKIEASSFNPLDTLTCSFIIFY